MRNATLPFVGVLLVLAIPGLGSSQTYVGEIIIVGNTYTADRYIRAHIDFYPGQVLNYSKLRAAEQKIEKLNWFRTDPKNDVRPTVTVLESAGPYKDILVKVEERPGNWARLAAWELALAHFATDYPRYYDAIHLLRQGIGDLRQRGVTPPPEAPPLQRLPREKD